MVLSKEQLGKRIKNAREHKARGCGKKYTQSMLAKEVGISRSYLGDIEAGRKYPNYALLSKLAKACEVPINIFDVENYDEAFKRIRAINNISLEELSNRTNLPIESLEKIENNEEISLAVEQWLAIGKELNLSSEETFKIIFTDVFCKSILTGKFSNDIIPAVLNNDLNSPFNSGILGCNGSPDNLSMVTMLPVYNSLSFSQPSHIINANEYFPLDIRSIDNNAYSKQDFFYFRVQGDNMEPTLLDMELALIHRQPSVDLNEIALVLHNTGAAVFARVIIANDKIVLHFDNRHYLPQVYNHDECKIIGKAIKRVGDLK